MSVCPHCAGTGFARDPAVEIGIEVRAISLRASCETAGKAVFADGLVDEATAAWLLGRKPNTLRNWRMGRQPIAFEKHGGRVSYRLTDIARWLVETGSSGEI